MGGPAAMRTLGLSTIGIAVLLAGGVGGYFLGRDDDGGGRAENAAASRLPAGWNLCINRVYGFAIGYPSGWDEEHEVGEGRLPQGACAFFDPKPLGISPPFYGSALEVHAVEGTLKHWISDLVDGELTNDGDCPVARHSVDRLEVAGRRAARVDGIGTHSCGIRVYAYGIERGAGVLVVQTTTEPGNSHHGARKRRVDTAVRTLYFLKTLGEEQICRVPRVLGMTLREGRFRIRKARCIVGHIRRARSRRPGRIIAQSPRPGSRGLQVSLVIGRR